MKAARASPELLAGGLLFALVLLAAIFSRALQTHDPAQGDLTIRLLDAGAHGHLLGTDQMGRDLWSRLLAGLQWSMACAFTANLINLVIGTGLGLTGLAMVTVLGPRILEQPWLLVSLATYAITAVIACTTASRV